LFSVVACAFRKTTLYRYVPTGFRPNRTAAVHPDHRPKVSFFGTVKFRVACWGEVRRQLGLALQIGFGIWDDTTFYNYIKNHSMFVSVAKGCERQYVPAARMSDLLSSGGIVISMRCHPDDERMFRGLVTFVEFSQMGAAYERIASMSGQERQQVAANIKSEYAKRFAPSAIFERARVYELLDRLRRGLSSPLDPQLHHLHQRQQQQQPKGPPAVAGSTQSRRIYVWSGQPANQTEKKGYDYLLSPFLTTLLEGLKGSPVLDEWTLDVRALTTKAVARELDRASLQQKEVFFWVGIEGEKEVPWTNLRQRNIYTIFYRNEGCDEAAAPRGFHELWYPNWKLVETCNRSPGATVRRVPTGFLGSFFPSRHPPQPNAMLVRWWPHHRPSCEEAVSKALGAHAKIVHVSSKKDMGQMQGSIYSTWPESCLSGRFVHASQLSTLLSYQFLVVSVEPALLKDKAEYQDFVTFASSENLVAEFQKLARMSSQQRIELAFNRSAEFAYKFEPFKILQQTGIFVLLNGLRQH